MSHVEYAALLGRRGDVPAAIDAARRGLALDPELVAGHRILAEMLVRVGQREEARAHGLAILALEPDDVGAKDLLRSLRGGPGPRTREDAR
jgi:predicted TPR repeat methyltransferase